VKTDARLVERQTSFLQKHIVMPTLTVIAGLTRNPVKRKTDTQLAERQAPLLQKCIVMPTLAVIVRESR